MTKPELIEKLKALQGTGDTESQHSNADELLLAYINDDNITQEWEKIDKWYA